ncbi:porin [Cupriavidus necator]|nr:porin [Cupriavidus necator]MDX6010467.1 porin [Cupriavidus necator]
MAASTISGREHFPPSASRTTPLDRRTSIGWSARVPGSVKYQSANFASLTFGALYGFGGVAGSFSSGNTVSLGVNYSSGWFAAGAAYTDVKYLQMNNGQDGIRNFGAGMRYSFGPVMTSVLYAHTENTQAQGQIGANWSLAPAWTLGGNVQYMKGNAILLNNDAVPLTSTLMYRFSKRTAVYAEGVYQRASGDGPATGAWINGLFGPNAASSGRTQVLGQMGITSAF